MIFIIIVLIVAAICALYGIFVAHRAKEDLSGLFWMALALTIAVIVPQLLSHV